MIEDSKKPITDDLTDDDFAAFAAAFFRTLDEEEENFGQNREIN